MRQTYGFSHRAGLRQGQSLGLLFSLSGSEQYLSKGDWVSFLFDMSQIDYLVGSSCIRSYKLMRFLPVSFSKRKLAYFTVIYTVRGQTLSLSYGR